MMSPVTLEVEGAPLRGTLELLLKQLDLGYVVQDGMLKFGNAPAVSSATPFRRAGHCYRALLAAFCGGCAGRTLYNATHSLQYEDQGTRATRQVETA
jgi:hypothetical protein